MSEDFKWTDELVKEFVKTYNNIGNWITGTDPIGKTIQEFKENKMPKKERIDVRILPNSHAFYEDKTYFTMQVAKRLDYPFEFDKIKAAIENIINNE